MRKTLSLFFSALGFFSLCFLFLLLPPKSSASGLKQITIVNPIRGGDFQPQNFQILNVPENQYAAISKDGLAATWLVRYDALKNPQVISFLTSLNSSQEVGLFLEITPSLTTDAGVKYNQSPSWHYAQSVLLVGYTPQDRQKLIDTAVSRYKAIFGQNPKSVGAWWIDAFSLNYLRQHYGIDANLDVSDQFSTDQYQVWGQYFSTPFYPAKNNALMPAQTPDAKIGVVTIQWANRDPFNGYGNGVEASTYSVQANDYLHHGLGTDYFKKLLDIYPQVTVGMENDFSWNQYGGEYLNQINLVSQEQSAGALTDETMSQFAANYDASYPDVSPPVLISADDPLRSGGHVVWYQTPQYRAGWFYNGQGSVIRDLRLYNNSIPEPCFSQSCTSLNLNADATSVIDDVNFGTHLMVDEGKISNLAVAKTTQGVKISYNNQANQPQVVEFLPNNISINGNTKTIEDLILNTLSSYKPTASSSQGQRQKFTGAFDKGNIPVILVNLLKFIPEVIIFFIIPGLAITGSYLLSLPVGWVSFTLLAFLLGVLRVDFLIWLLPVASIFTLAKRRVPVLDIKQLLRDLRIGTNLIAFVLILVGTAFWMLTSAKDGLMYDYGLGYWGPAGHDAIWHLSLIADLQRNIPPQNPIFAGTRLVNYHYFFDLLLARSGSLFGIDNQELLFRLFPLLIALMAGILTFKFMIRFLTKMGRGKERVFLGAIVSVFLVYFGGSFGWLVDLLRHSSQVGQESMFWSMQAFSTLINPPFAISLIFILSVFYIFVDYSSKPKRSSLLALVLLSGTLIEFKAYAGVIVIASLGMVALLRMLKRDFSLFPYALLSGVLGGALYLYNNAGSTSLFVFSPLWFIDSMLKFQDRFDFPRLSLTINSGVWYKVILGNALGLLIFIIGNFGTRVLGFGSLKEMWKETVGRLIIFISLFGALATLLFIQVGTGWNTIQFFYYSVFAFALLTGVFISKIKKGILGVMGILALLTIPTSILSSGDYTSSIPPAALTKGEYQALNFLKSQPQGTVLTLPFDPNVHNAFSDPVPLGAYVTSAYVSAFSNHPVFMEDYGNLEIMGIDYTERLNLENTFANDVQRGHEILKENNISYVYVGGLADVPWVSFPYHENERGMKKIFEDPQGAVFKVAP